MYEEALNICKANNIPCEQLLQTVRKIHSPQKFKSFFIHKNVSLENKINKLDRYNNHTELFLPV